MTPAEIAEACGITERQLFFLIGRYSRCLRQFGVLSPNILDFGLGDLAIRSNLLESELGFRTFDLGVTFRPKAKSPNLTFGVTRIVNTQRRNSFVPADTEKSGWTTSQPLGQRVNQTGVYLMLDQQFQLHPFAKVGYELRSNLMFEQAEVKNHGYAMLTASLDIDAILSNTLAIELCGISIELGGFMELMQIDQTGQTRLTSFLPSVVSSDQTWSYNEFGLTLNLGYHF